MLLTISVTPRSVYFFFFFNDTATTEIYTLSLHDALPISSTSPRPAARRSRVTRPSCSSRSCPTRSEEHTSELQSHLNLVCRLLLEKKKNKTKHGPAILDICINHFLPLV